MTPNEIFYIPLLILLGPFTILFSEEVARDIFEGL